VTNNKYLTDRRVPTFNRKIVETKAKSTTIHSHGWV
jgi:hypothetical protein